MQPGPLQWGGEGASEKGGGEGEGGEAVHGDVCSLGTFRVRGEGDGRGGGSSAW